MTISAIKADNRRRELQIRAGGRRFIFPYAKLRLPPTADDPITEVFPDSEIGLEGFTYRLGSGAEDTVHMDAVLEINMDPDHLQHLLLYRLTVEAQQGLQKSGLGKRQVARMLGTSPSQLYRLLDPTNTEKSLGQLLYLLHLVNREVKLVISERGADWTEAQGAPPPGG